MTKNLSLYTNENELMTERTLLTNSKDDQKIDGFNTSRIKNYNFNRDAKNMKRKFALNNTSFDFIKTPR